MIAKACIFDFDGVVIDSEKYHHLSWQEIAHHLGVDFPYAEYQPFKSGGRKVVIPYLLNKAGIAFSQEKYAELDKLRTASIAKALENLCEEDITPGIVDFLKTLKANDIPCAVASSSANAHETALRFGIFHLFDAFVDGETGLPNKPAPDLFLMAAQRLKVPANQCVVFEDSLNGLFGAKAAGMHCVGIQTDFCDVADKIIRDFVGIDLSILRFEE